MRLLVCFIILISWGCENAAEIVSSSEITEEDLSTSTTLAGVIYNRPGGEVSFSGEQPRAGRPVALLVSGGEWSNDNFPNGVREHFLRLGIAPITIQRPADMAAMPHSYREDNDHLRDIEAIVDFVRKKVPDSPVWLVGISLGTTSIAQVAARKRVPIDGIVLLSSISKTVKGIGPLTAYPLNTIRVPVLLVAHNKEACDCCPVSKTSNILSALTLAKTKQAFYYDGGSATGDVCNLAHYHGFRGIREQVYSDVGNWMLSPSSD